MITVHHLNNSRSQRVLWLLEELGVPYEVKRYERDSKTMLAPAALKKIHPLGKSPVITDGDITVAESGAIMEYLVGKYGNGTLIPAPDTAERLRYTYWLHYAEGSAMMPLLLTLIFSEIPKAPMPFFVRPIVKGIADKVKAQFVNPQLSLHFNYIESELGKTAWFAGTEFTAADVQMSFPVEAAMNRGGIRTSHPTMAAWLQKVQARPAYQRALAKGGPYDYA
ncbi:MAG: glutathione S-transferase [Moraxellaceae bacterium]|nr:glutathione S-transferase [Moraxellaceae bacterium]